MHSPSQSDLTSNPPPPPAADPAPNAARRTLLVVDDEEGPRKSIRAVFKNDYNVLLADSGSQAVEIAQKCKLDAAVLDIRMSDMSGIEVLEQLKKIDASIEVIMLTAYETTETARQALRLGASDYLDKPFDVATIRASVASAMSRRALTDEMRSNSQRLQELQAEIQQHKVGEEVARAKGDIYASIIHDLNSPLAVIAGFVELINMKIGDVQNQDAPPVRQIRDHLGHITRQINKSIDVSRRYLSFIRQRSVPESRVNVNQIMDELDELLRVHPDLKANEVHVQHLATDAEVFINGIDLIQVLLNLAGNAFQCTDQPHKVEVRATRLPRAVGLDSVADGPANRFINREGFDTTGPVVAITVSDNGPGIPPEFVPQMFSSSFTTKSAGKGTGLGLSIVLRFIKQARGAVHLQTRLGSGTVITIYLPAT